MLKNVFQISDRHTDRLGDFRRLAYTEWGEADNPRVAVCVHGMTRNGRDFDVFAESLCDSHRVLCIDLAGRGESGWLREAVGYMPATYISDIRGRLASYNRILTGR